MDRLALLALLPAPLPVVIPLAFWQLVHAQGVIFWIVHRVDGPRRSKSVGRISWSN